VSIIDIKDIRTIIECLYTNKANQIDARIMAMIAD